MAKPGEKKITMREIADDIGVSVVTVSKALSGKDGVSSRLRERIMKRAVEMGYPRASAVENYVQSHSVGVLVADRYFSENSFYFNLYRSLLAEASAKDLLLVLEIVSPQDEREHATPQTVKNGRVNGIIFLGEMELGYINNVISAGLPYVFLDFYIYGLNADSILSDNTYGTYTLTNLLFNTGHQRIAFVGSIRSTSSIMDRFLGYCRSMAMHGCDLRRDWVIDDRDEDGILFDSIPIPDELPDAFVCNCDVTTGLLIMSLKAKGLNVPEDISVVGYDDHGASNMYLPSFTTYRVNAEAMAEAAVIRIVNRIQGLQKNCEKTVIAGTIIERQAYG